MSIVIISLSIIGYVIVGAFVIGLMQRFDDLTGIVSDGDDVFIGMFWPIFLVLLIIAVIGYYPYKIAVGDFKIKRE